MAALVAVALAQAGDNTPLLAAILADRYRPARVIAAAGVALAIGHGVAAVAGAAFAPKLTPEAKLLLLALSLLFAGGSALLPLKEPDRLSGWRLGALATSLLGLLVIAFGDSAQFITAALAARTTMPPLAAVGATLGSLAAVATAALLGEAGWRALPLRAVRIGGAGVFLVTGGWCAVAALSLV